MCAVFLDMIHGLTQDLRQYLVRPPTRYRSRHPRLLHDWQRQGHQQVATQHRRGAQLQPPRSCSQDRHVDTRKMTGISDLGRQICVLCNVCRQVFGHSLLICVFYNRIQFHAFKMCFNISWIHFLGGEGQYSNLLVEKKPVNHTEPTIELKKDVC